MKIAKQLNSIFGKLCMVEIFYKKDDKMCSQQIYMGSVGETPNAILFL